MGSIASSETAAVIVSLWTSVLSRISGLGLGLETALWAPDVAEKECTVLWMVG